MLDRVNLGDVEDRDKVSESENETNRKLASIEVIRSIRKIEGADRIVLAVVNGWQCVVKKGEFEEGDKCIYFEVDSLLPMEDKYSFLEKSSYRKENDLNPEGYRLRTVKLRGEVSQGLALPLSVFDKDYSKLGVGCDVTKELGVKKYNTQDSVSIHGRVSGGFSPYTSKTDEPRIQSNLNKLEEIQGKEYYITLKYDGSSMTIEYIDGELSLYSRSNKIKKPVGEGDLKKESAMWYTVRKLGIEDKLRGYGQDIILKGELIGPGIQGNLLRLKDYSWVCFTVESLDSERRTGVRVGYDKFKEVTDELKIPRVDILEEGIFDYTLEELLELSKGKYESGKNREGIVIRPKEGDLSFKVINNDYLLKEER